MLASERCCLPPAASPGHRRARDRSKAARGNVSTVLERGSVEMHCHLNGGRTRGGAAGRARALTCWARFLASCAGRGQAKRRSGAARGARGTTVAARMLSPSQLPADALIASVGGIPCVEVTIGCRGRWRLAPPLEKPAPGKSTRRARAQAMPARARARARPAHMPVHTLDDMSARGQDVPSARGAARERVHTRSKKKERRPRKHPRQQHTISWGTASEAMF